MVKIQANLMVKTQTKSIKNLLILFKADNKH